MASKPAVNTCLRVTLQLFIQLLDREALSVEIGAADYRAVRVLVDPGNDIAAIAVVKSDYILDQFRDLNAC